MNPTILPFVSPLLVLGVVAAQTPNTRSPNQPESEVQVQSLQALLTDTVYARNAAAGGEGTGTSIDQPFAQIRDAEFSPDGRLTSLIVAAPPNAKAPDATTRVLAATVVRWDSATRRWTMTQPTMQFAELPASEVRVDKDKLDKKMPAIDTKPPRLASELLRSEPAEGDAKARATEASATKVAERIVWWFAPEAKQLAVVTMPKDGKHFVVPWSALRFEGNTESPRVRTEPAAALDNAPTCADANELPCRALRLRGYAHYGVTPPPWERAADDKRPGKDKDGDGKDPGKR